MNYTETNKLIAEFMKWKKVNAGLVGYETPHSVALIQPSEMLFRDSWNWLMPVVEKINLLDDYNYTVYIASMDTTIRNNNTGKVVIDVSCENSVDELRKSVYKAVVEFIKFYNQNK